MNKKLPHENRVVKVDFLFYFRPRNDARKKNIFQLTQYPFCSFIAKLSSPFKKSKWNKINKITLPSNRKKGLSCLAMNNIPK